ncbi:MAG: CCA tRNA nucleotidyltransferase, partial [Bdellovibrionota bacterium]
MCRTLRSAGFTALLAGGCVRDMLMSREPNDFDVATDATPDQVETLFPRAVAVGKAFGVIVLPQDGFDIEVATFREDLEYKDGRRPEGVKFSSPELDAKRRDFTVNALFLEPESGKISDFVGGQNDLTARILRTVGEPDRRFTEDKLRLLR